uniref:peptidyl-tRNA hydrolase n=1 Tax=Cacopsylla melanoneura TaxID=428564 RepID=A0A8D8ZGB8_9HEMI
MMDFILSNATKLLFVGSATLSVYVYWNYLYNAFTRSNSRARGGNEGRTLTQEDDMGKLPTLSASSSSFVGSIKADFSPIYMIVLNVQNLQRSTEESKKYVKRVTMESARKLSTKDPALLAQWSETKEYYVVKVEKDVDLKRLAETAKIREIQRVLIRDEDTKTCVALGLGPAKAIDVKIVLYENFFRNITNIN